MVIVSHALNVLILIAVVPALWRDAPGTAEAFGPDTPARRILMCVYLAILLTSVVALILAGMGHYGMALTIGLVLFPMQILYKTATAFAVGIDNPVVITNLVVVVVHSITLATLAMRA
ncbi:hypothetical protein KDD17_12985 [Sulfitobacter albidus]|uniref:Uncharacterized protein n=1 Tax=Sulfitobacter albidus TaxID=2829501 RepID=A0A975PM43_9RHOB|nr:hypothetical protein [Sulfitobacter albidus]QUJ75845.1 hypothetical protein KDD17_12985 [Sulfitobacter albidus]